MKKKLSEKEMAIQNEIPDVRPFLMEGVYGLSESFNIALCQSPSSISPQSLLPKGKKSLLEKARNWLSHVKASTNTNNQDKVVVSKFEQSLQPSTILKKLSVLEENRYLCEICKTISSSPCCINDKCSAENCREIIGNLQLNIVKIIGIESNIDDALICINSNHYSISSKYSQRSFKIPLIETGQEIITTLSLENENKNFSSLKFSFSTNRCYPMIMSRMVYRFPIHNSPMLGVEFKEMAIDDNMKEGIFVIIECMICPSEEKFTTKFFEHDKRLLEIFSEKKEPEEKYFDIPFCFLKPNGQLSEIKNIQIPAFNATISNVRKAITMDMHVGMHGYLSDSSVLLEAYKNKENFVLEKIRSDATIQQLREYSPFKLIFHPYGLKAEVLHNIVNSVFPLDRCLSEKEITSTISAIPPDHISTLSTNSTPRSSINSSGSSYHSIQDDNDEMQNIVSIGELKKLAEQKDIEIKYWKEQYEMKDIELRNAKSYYEVETSRLTKCINHLLSDSKPDAYSSTDVPKCNSLRNKGNLEGVANKIGEKRREVKIPCDKGVLSPVSPTSNKHQAIEKFEIVLSDDVDYHSPKINVQEMDDKYKKKVSIVDPPLKSCLKKVDSQRNINHISFSPISLLIDTAAEGDLDLFKKILKENPTTLHINSANDRGICSLHYAAANADRDLMKYLLENGASVHIVDEEEWSALHYAAITNNIELVKLLVKYGANVELKNIDDKSPIDLAENYQINSYLSEISDRKNNALWVHALYDWEGEEKDELSFKAGEKLTVLARDYDDNLWWLVVNQHGEEGLIPAIFVQ